MIDFKAFRKPVQKKPVTAQQLKDKILLFVRQRGPVLPMDVAREVGKNSIMVGAMLSELIANRLVRITKCKIGSSPLYYVSGQEGKLGKIREYLSQRPKQIFDILKEKKILKDSELEAWQRVAIREIKDFAHPLEVTIEDVKEIFWKWHTLANEEVNKLISKIINPEAEKEEPKEERKEPEKEEVKKPEVKEEPKEEKKEEPKEEIKQTKLVEKKEEKKVKIAKSPLRDKVLGYFGQTNINILEELSGKKTECSFIINFGSPIGKLKYLVIAKSKKKLSDDDVHIAHSMGVHQKLPVLLLAKDIGKKAEKTLNEKGITFKKIT